MSPRSPVTLPLALSLVAALVVGSGGPLAAQQRTQAKTQITRVKLARGVVLLRILDRSGPYRIFALVVNPSRGARVETMPAGAVLPAIQRTSAMAQAAAGAIAAVNGDFGADNGSPTHPYVEGGDLIQTGLHPGSVFAVTSDERRIYMGPPDVSIRVDGAGFAPRKVAAWNGGPPIDNQMNAFTDEGGTVEVPPSGTCFARLVPEDSPSWAPGGLGMAQRYTVGTLGCGTPPAPSGGVVLSALPTSIRTRWLQKLAPGQKLTITRSIGWPGVTEALGGMPLIMANGLVVAPDVCTPVDFCYRNPRTGVGVTAGCISGASMCRIILLTVDGRRPGYSVGMTFPEMAAAFRSLGATWAMNLDGGGSTTMWIRGKGVVNRPSDGVERAVPNALVIVPAAS